MTAFTKADSWECICLGLHFICSVNVISTIKCTSLSLLSENSNVNGAKPNWFRVSSITPVHRSIPDRKHHCELYCNNLSLLCGLLSMLRTGQLDSAQGQNPRALCSYPVISPQNSDKLLLKFPQMYVSLELTIQIGKPCCFFCSFA